MHAYLFVGSETSDIKNQISNLAKNLHAKIMEFPLTKIEDVRNLNNLIRLSFNEPTLIVSTKIHEAGEEALNAFLKNLEEPQENIYFALTTSTLSKVLPTIISRCKIIRTINNLKSTIDGGEMEKFIKMSTGEKLSFVDKIKDREKAIEFTEELAFFLHSQLHENAIKYSVDAARIETVLKTLSGLNANGNVNLHLSNLIINLK